MVSVSNVIYQYPGDKVLRFPDFTIAKNEHCLLLGESGSGKTTLMHLLGGLLRLKNGSIRINGTEITSLTESQLDHFRGRNIGFIFQRNHLISALTVQQNLMLAPFLAGMPSNDERTADVLGHLGLFFQKNKPVGSLSQGQAQRVAIARAILNNPPLILADEPTSALDDKNCSRVIELLFRVADEIKSTLLIATHDHRLKNWVSNQIMLTSQN